MRYFRGSSTSLGVSLYGIPQNMHPNDALLGTSLFSDYILRVCHLSGVVLTHDYFAAVEPSHRSTASDDVRQSGKVEVQQYSVEDDVRKYSHSIAAAISYLGQGLPSPNPGDRGFLHIDFEGTLRAPTAPVYTYTDVSVVDFLVRAIDQRSGALQRIYAVIAPSGNVFPSPLHVSNWYSWAGNIVDLVKLNTQAYRDSHGVYLPATIGGPKMQRFLDWGPAYFHAIESISGKFSHDSVVLEWIEWYSNVFGQVRKCTVKCTLRAVQRPSSFWEGNVYLPRCFDLSYSFHCESQWYAWTGVGPVYGTLTPTTSYVSDVADIISVPNFPLNTPGGALSDPPDISSLFEEAQKCLERARVGCGSSTVELLRELREVSANWIEFAGEFSEVFELLPLDILRQYAGYFNNSGKGFLHGLRAVLKAISSAYIALSFSISPLVSTGEDLSATALALSERLSTFEPRRIRSGRVNITPSPSLFEGLLIFPEKMTVVSACNIGVPFSGDIPGTLQLDSTGALPLPSRFWDLAPWSWAIDYFTRFQDRIESVEAIILLSLWRADGFTHSVSFTISDQSVIDWLQAHGYEVEPSTLPDFRCYMREVSALIPFLCLREEYHLADTDVRPNWLILAALALSFAL
jgi:hypothetical protein